MSKHWCPRCEKKISHPGYCGRCKRETAELIALSREFAEQERRKENGSRKKA